MSEQNILHWAEQVELLPEGYRAISVRRASFAVGVGENPEARPGERWSVCTGRTAALEGRTSPMPGEPFSEYFAREVLARNRADELCDDLGLH